MSTKSLQNLNSQFDQALLNNSYLGLNNASLLEVKEEKSIRLGAVFDHAIAQMTTIVSSKSKLNDAEILELKNLESSGERLYLRYKKSTNTWVRISLKYIAKFTPNFLKKYLPSCFSNKMAEAEIATKGSFEAFLKTARQIVDNNHKKRDNTRGGHTSSKKENNQSNTDRAYSPTSNFLQAPRPIKTNSFDADKEEEFIAGIAKVLNNPHPTPFCPKSSAEKIENSFARPHDLIPEIVARKPGFQQPPRSIAPEEISTEILEKIDKNRKAYFEKIITKSLDFLNKVETAPLSLVDFNLCLESLLYGLSGLSEKDREPNFARFGLNNENANHLLRSDLRDYINQQKVKVDVITSLNISNILAKTPWKNGYRKAISKAYFLNLNSFKINKIEGTSDPLLTNQNGDGITDENIDYFRTGEVHICLNKLPDPSLLELIRGAIKIFNEYECSLHTVRLKFSNDQRLSKELVIELLRLNERATILILEGISEIDFASLALDEETELEFIRKMGLSIQFPNLQDFSLSKDFKKSWNADDYAHIIYLHPTLKILEHCFKYCPNYKDIAIFSVFEDQTILDLSSYKLDQLPYLLPHFPNLNHLKLSGQPLEDAMIEKWVAHPIFYKLSTLELDGCTKLTTDVINSLASMPHLTNLVLPDLPQGKIDVLNLPMFDNPYKIKMLYLASSATRAIASSLYCGLDMWASIFQIPLARAGEKDIFLPYQTELDPCSTALWLKNDDYENLAPQLRISTVIAEANAHLTDDNIGKFMQKFPKTTLLSLSECPNITEKGVFAALKACPNLSILDLSHCRNVGDGLLLNEASLNALKTCIQIDLTGTSISQETIADAVENKKISSIKWQESRLKFADIGEEIRKYYPQVFFQNEDKPYSIAIDVENQLEACKYYQKQISSQLSQELTEENQKYITSQLTKGYIFNRFSVELFHPDQDAIKTITDFSMNQISFDYSDFELTFKTLDDDQASVSHQVNSDLLYIQSSYFRSLMRAGGGLINENKLLINSVHATEKVAYAFIDLLYKYLEVDYRISWETALDLAVLIGPNNLQFSENIYQALLQKIYDDCNLENANEILLKLHTLKDAKFKDKIENLLIAFFHKIDSNHENDFKIISNLANSHKLENLLKLVKERERIKNTLL